MEEIIMLFIGIVIAIMGIINMTGNISTVHSYNRRRVREEDVPKYGKAVGLGTLIIGVAIIVGYILTLWEQVDLRSYVLLSGLVIGLAFILYAQFKYNKGIF